MTHHCERRLLTNGQSYSKKGVGLEIEYIEVLDLFNIKEVKIEKLIAKRNQSESQELKKANAITSNINELPEKNQLYF